MHVSSNLLRSIGITCFLATLLALVPPWLLRERENARRQVCQDNLRRITAALLQYEARHGRLPPANLADEQGHPLHSWRVLILPFLDQQELYEKYSFDEAWDGPHNRQLAARMPDVYRCPAASFGAPATSYSLVTGPGLESDADRSRQTGEIAEAVGRNHKILVLENPAAQINWMEPRDPSPALAEPGSAHSAVIHAGFADGHVRALSTSIARKVFLSLLNGG